jgi:hypothetical protein
MDYLLSKGMRKMPKIPDKMNHQSSFNQTLKVLILAKSII